MLGASPTLVPTPRTTRRRPGRATGGNEEATQQAYRWLRGNPQPKEEEFHAVLGDLERVVNPILMKARSGAGSEFDDNACAAMCKRWVGALMGWAGLRPHALGAMTPRCVAIYATLPRQHPFVLCRYVRSTCGGLRRAG